MKPKRFQEIGQLVPGRMVVGVESIGGIQAVLKLRVILDAVAVEIVAA